MRTPTSAPLARTIGLTRSAVVTPSAGSTVIVVPRASFSWKPRPALTKNSVSAHGPNTNESLGLAMLSLAEPLFTSRSLSTSKCGAVEPQASDHAQPVGGLHLLLGEEAQSQALHGILSDGRAAHATFGEIEAYLADVVESGFDTEAQLAGQAADTVFTADLGVHAIGLAIVELLELIAVRGVDGVGEIREQVEVVVERVRVRLEAPVSERLFNFEVERVAMRFAAVGWVDESKAV